MKKPTPKTQRALVYSEIIDYIEKKYKIKTRDYAGTFASNHFEKWCEKYGYKYVPAFGDTLKEHTRLYAKYRVAKDGDCMAPPYQDFWHFVIDNVDGVSNDTYIDLPIQMWLDDEGVPSWVKEILRYINKEFPGDTLHVWSSW